MGDLGFLRDTAFWYTPHLKDGRPMRHDVALLAADRIAELEARIASQVVTQERHMPLLQENLELKARLAEQGTCEDCDGTGWCENAVEGRHACVCVEEMEPYALLKAENKRMRDALDRYGAHDFECPYLNLTPHLQPCNCGYSKALREVE